MENLKLGLYLLLATLTGLYAREHVRALVDVRLGDPSPRQFGWLRPNPRGRMDAFGSVILPILIAVLWGANAAFKPPPFAYAKPMPFEPHSLRSPSRDVILVSLAGPLTNLAAGVVAGLALRVVHSGEAVWVLYFVLYANVVLFVFHLMPVPGLDGARILGMFLPPHAREVYRNLDQYLVLFVLVVFFLFGTPLLGIVNGLTDGVCSIVVGAPCSPV